MPYPTAVGILGELHRAWIVDDQAHVLVGRAAPSEASDIEADRILGRWVETLPEALTEWMEIEHWPKSPVRDVMRWCWCSGWLLSSQDEDLILPATDRGTPAAGGGSWRAESCVRARCRGASHPRRGAPRLVVRCPDAARSARTFGRLGFGCPEHGSRRARGVLRATRAISRRRTGRLEGGRRAGRVRSPTLCRCGWKRARRSGGMAMYGSRRFCEPTAGRPNSAWMRAQAACGAAPSRRLRRCVFSLW